MLDDCTLTNSLQEGVNAQTLSSLFIERCSIWGNAGAAVANSGSGSVFTFGDNYIAFNGSNNTGIAASPGKQ